MLASTCSRCPSWGALSGIVRGMAYRTVDNHHQLLAVLFTRKASGKRRGRGGSQKTLFDCQGSDRIADELRGYLDLVATLRLEGGTLYVRLSCRSPSLFREICRDHIQGTERTLQGAHPGVQCLHSPASLFLVSTEGMLRNAWGRKNSTTLIF